MIKWLYLTLFQCLGTELGSLIQKRRSQFLNFWIAWFLLSESDLPTQNVKWGGTTKTQENYRLHTIGSFHKTHWQAQAQISKTKCLCFLCSGQTSAVFLLLSEFNADGATKCSKIKPVFTCTHFLLYYHHAVDYYKSRKSVHTDLIGSQDSEGGDDLLSGVGIGRLSGHEVDEGLEGDCALSVGIHQSHDAGKFCFSLRQGCQEMFTCTAHFLPLSPVDMRVSLCVKT